MQPAHIIRQLPVLFALGTFLVACDAPGPIVAPDGLQPQFGRGGGGGPPPTTPITLSATGAFVVDPGTPASINTDTEMILDFGYDGQTYITSTANFDATYGMATSPGIEFSECASDPADMSLAAREALIEWLHGVTRTGGFGAAIDKLSFGIPSATNEVRSMSQKPDPVAPLHVNVGSYSLLPDQEPVTVTKTVLVDEREEYTFTGGAVWIRDRSGKVKDFKTLVCPNYDTVVITIDRTP